MPDTIDHQIEHLSELHAAGTLTDEEFAAAKSSAIHESPGAGASGTASETPMRFGIGWVLLAAVVLGGIFLGAGMTAEWSGVQQPAAIFVCPGGTFHPGFAVSHSVATKGVDLASSCTRAGQVHSISGLVMFVVLSLEYMTIAFVALLALRTLSRHRHAGHDLDRTEAAPQAS